MILGLDYDDTISIYAEGLKQICKNNVVHVITVNNVVKSEHISKLLNCEINMHVMADEDFDIMLEDCGVGRWKANKCKELGVELMIDDMDSVCKFCSEIGIPTIQVKS